MPSKITTSIQTDGTEASDPKAYSLFVGSTEKTFQILHAFNGPQKHVPLYDVAKAVGLDRSTAQRLVYTLETLGYLWRVHKIRNYALTSKTLQFAYNFSTPMKSLKRQRHTFWKSAVPSARAMSA